MKLLMILSLGAVGSLPLIPSNEKSSSPTDAVVTPVNAPRKEASDRVKLLTSNIWIYEEYIRDFSTERALQVFKKNKVRNSFDLSKNWVRFYADGTFEEFNEQGIHYKGSWQLLENETKLSTVIPGSHHSNTSTITLLSKDKFEWHDDNWDTYGEMIPLAKDTTEIDPAYL
ncbi:MAG TPA: hypothetical protein VFR58_12265 [Flavisolibacter sp.]|nr:hypothetical protein [Flavisolibacter sp.]